MHKQTAGKQLHFFLITIALLLIDLQKYIIATEAQKHRNIPADFAKGAEKKFLICVISEICRKLFLIPLYN